MPRRQRNQIVTAEGWNETYPDLTTSEHDTLAGLLERAWSDVQIDLNTVPPERYEEAVAAKLTAYEWFMFDADDYADRGMNPPRISFTAACLHLGMHEEEVLKVVLRGVRIPEGVSVPQRWRDEYLGPEDPEHNRDDRVYVKATKRAKMEAAVQLDLPLPPCTYCKPLDDDRPAPAFTLESLMGQVLNITVNSTANWTEAAEEDALQGVRRRS